MPTSNGLSYWIHCLPRSECPIGAFTRSAKAMTSSWAPSTPAPAKIATVFALSIAAARRRTSSSAGTSVGALRRDERRERSGCIELGDIAGQHDHRHAGPGERVPKGRVHDPRRLRGRGDLLAVVRALDEEALGMRLLEVARTDLGARNVAGDREHRRTRAMRVVEAVDEVQVARTAAARAHGDPPGELRLGGGHECGGLLVAHVDPVDAALRLAAASPYRVDDGIQRVPDDAVDVIDPRIDELGDELVGDGACHDVPPSDGVRVEFSLLWSAFRRRPRRRGLVRVHEHPRGCRYDGQVVFCGSGRHRAVAQLGSALDWGSRGRRFKSCQPD